jgi:hypothetical protein
MFSFSTDYAIVLSVHSRATESFLHYITVESLIEMMPGNGVSHRCMHPVPGKDLVRGRYA